VENFQKIFHIIFFRKNYITTTNPNCSVLVHLSDALLMSSVTHKSRVQIQPVLLLSNNLEQVIYTCGAQANSVFRPPGLAYE